MVENTWWKHSSLHIQMSNLQPTIVIPAKYNVGQKKMNDNEILAPINGAAWEKQNTVAHAIARARRQYGAFRYIKACCETGWTLACLPLSNERYMEHKCSTLPRLDAYFADFEYAAKQFIETHSPTL